MKLLSESPSLVRNSTRSLAELGSSNKLLIGQTCGLPLILNPKCYRVLGTPQYNAIGCSEHFYRSAIITRDDSVLIDLRSCENKIITIASNSACSLSGSLLLSATLGVDLLSKSEKVITGSHYNSISAVREGRADIASIDCVTLALIRDTEPTHLQSIRVIGHTLRAPALPYVTSYGAADETVQGLRSALTEALSTLDGAVKSKIRLRGLKVSVSDDELAETAVQFAEYLSVPDSELEEPSDSACNFVKLYELYIRTLRVRATLPSRYRLYSPEDEE